MAVTGAVGVLASSLPDVCWLSFSREDISLLLLAVLANPTTVHLLPSLVDRLNDYSIPSYQQYVEACKSEDTDERETDDGAVVSPSDGGVWVQTWTWVSAEMLADGEEEDSESTSGADVTVSTA